MPYAAAYSKQADVVTALPELCDELREGLSEDPDLLLLFVSHEHSAAFDELAAKLHEQFNGAVLLGCTGETVICGGEEIESGPAVALWAAALPDAELVPFRLEFSQTPDGVMCAGLPAGLEQRHENARLILLLGEPFSSLPQSMIDRFANELPGVPIVGGMASGANAAGENRLFLGGEAIVDGAVGVVICGGLPIQTLVSQGCRPIGEVFLATKAEQNIVSELGGVSPIERLHELLPSLPKRDQQLAQRGLHLGVAMSEYQETFQRGDFLISNVVAADRESGAIAVGTVVRPGQTVQFHVRDATTADEDLVNLLNEHRQKRPGSQAALLFSCNGRGTRLFPEPNHDAGRIQEKLGPLPLAGIFAQGELGPVGGSNYVHGFTASLALFG